MKRSDTLIDLEEDEFPLTIDLPKVPNLISCFNKETLFLKISTEYKIKEEFLEVRYSLQPYEDQKIPQFSMTITYSKEADHPEMFKKQYSNKLWVTKPEVMVGIFDHLSQIVSELEKRYHIRLRGLNEFLPYQGETPSTINSMLATYETGIPHLMIQPKKDERENFFDNIKTF